MSDIFISYKRGPDAGLVEGLVQSFRANGFSVWWDRDIPARAPWEETIESELRKAHIVVVCWSPGAVASENVKSEARWAKERGKLLQTFVAPCDPPLFFGEHQGIQIFSPSDLYGPRFEGLASAARAMIDAAAPPELAAAGEKIRNEKRAAAPRRVSQSWRKEEPAQPWEALQFGLTLSLLCTLIIGGVFFAYISRGDLFNTTVTKPVWLMLVISGGVITPLASLFGGWSAYRMMAQFPRRVGFFTAFVFSFLAGFLGGLLPLAASGVALLMQPGMPEEYASMQLPVLMLGLAAAGLAVGFVLTRIWAPFFFGLLRKALSSGPTRAVVALVAIGLPAALTAGALAHGGGAVPLESIAGMSESASPATNLLYGGRRAGIFKATDLGPQGIQVSPELEARLRQELGLAPGAPEDQLSAAIDALPAKVDWVLAADGTGDADTLEKILTLSVEAINVKVKPGVYRDLPAGADTGVAPRGTLASAFQTPDENPWSSYSGPAAPAAPAIAETDAIADAAAALPPFDSGSGFRSVSVVGDGPREQIVFEITQGVRLLGFSRLEGVTIRPVDGQLPALFDGSDTIQPTVVISGKSSLVNSVVTGGGGRGIDIYNASGDDYSRAAVRDNMVTGKLTTGITIGRGSVVDVIGNRVDRVGDKRWCIYVDTLNLVAVRGNDLTRCAPANFYRIWSLQRSQARISDNPGATDTPKIERDPDGVDDTAVY